MANNETLGASFSIDVTNLKAGLAQANRMIRESESEFKAAAAGMDDWRDSEEGLTAKIKSLNSITDAQKAKVSALQSEYDRMVAEGLDPTSAAAVELRTKINTETAALNKNEAELKKQKEALENLGDESEETADAVEETGSSLEGLKKAGGVAVKALAAVGAACVSAVTAFFGLAESTREARKLMGQLETSFETAGHSAEAAEQTFTDLYSIMGDEGAATEAAQQLAKFSKTEEDLAANTRILTGVMAEYGNSIPTEGLAEGMAASAAMSSVQGVLADALEWQGVNLEEYNKQLEALATEEERAAYIQSTLTDLYGASADAYRENNAEVIAAQKAQAEMNAAINDLGAIAEPIMTTLKQLATDLLVAITPFVSLIGEGLAGAMTGAEGAAENLAEGINGIITMLLDKLLAMLPFVIETIVAVIPTLLTEILHRVPQILSTVLGVLVQVINTISDMLPEILPLITNCIMWIIDRLIGAVPDLLLAAVKLFTAIVDAVPQIVAGLLENLRDIIVTIIWGLLNALPDLLQTAITLFTAIVDAIPLIVTELADQLPWIIETIIEGLTEAIPVLLDAAITLLMAIVDAIPTIITAIIDNLPTIIDAIVNGVLDALPLLLDAAITLFFALIDAIPTIVKELYKALPKIIESILTSIKNAVPKLFSTAKDLLGKIIDAAENLVKQLPSKMGEIIKSIVKGLKDGISKVTDIGGDIIKGLWNGISDMASWIGKKIRGFGESVLGGIKDFFGIHSPSKVMADEVGKNLALGIGKGFEDNIAGVNKQITGAMNFDGGVGVVGNIGGRAGGGIVVNQINHYSQAHSRVELYKTKQATAAAVRLAMAGA